MIGKLHITTLFGPRDRAGSSLATTASGVGATQPACTGCLGFDTSIACSPPECHASGHVGGAYEFDPPDEVEPPRPAPWRCPNHAKRGAVHLLDRIGQPPVQRHDAGPEVPDQGMAAWA